MSGVHPWDKEILAETCSVILVHGSQSHPYMIWTARGHLKLSDSDVLRRLRKPAPSSGPSNEQSKATDVVFWPKELLSKDCPDCRILTWTYSSHVSRLSKEVASQNSFLDHAKNPTFTDTASATTAKNNCPTITLNGVAVPAGQTLDLTGLTKGTHASCPCNA